MSQPPSFVERSPHLFVVAFLTLHGLIFLGVGYLISYANPGFSLLHSGIGILVYSIFLGILFPRQFFSALLVTVLTMIATWYWGDFLVDIFYPDWVERTFFHQAYAIMLTVYLYTFFDVLIFALRHKGLQHYWFVKKVSR